MVVDSKVSLTDYERYTNAEDEDRAQVFKRPYQFTKETCGTAFREKVRGFVRDGKS